MIICDNWFTRVNKYKGIFKCFHGALGIKNFDCSVNEDSKFKKYISTYFYYINTLSNIEEKSENSFFKLKETTDILERIVLLLSL